MDRRKFLASALGLGVGVSLSARGEVFYTVDKKEDSAPRTKFYGQELTPEWTYDSKSKKHKINKDYAIKHSVCLQCHGECGIRAKVNKKTGKLERIMGNPYNPNSNFSHTDIATDIALTAGKPGTVCARGSNGLQTAYDPYRVTTPLKRVGGRGSGKWKAISWEQMVKEVVEGGNIFDDTNDPLSKGVKVNGFRSLYQQRDKWIDDNNHDYGRVTNKLILQGGRIVKTRKDFQTRFAKSFGTVNNYEHTNVCELSHHIATGEVYGGKHQLKADLLESEYVLYWGTAPGEANFPMQLLARQSAEMRAKGGKITVIDPVLPRTVTLSPNMQWVPLKPGTDGAIAMGMIQWIIKNKKYNEKFLSYSNQKSALANGETCFSNSTHLVIVDEKHPSYGMFLTTKDAGLEGEGHVVIGMDNKPASSEMATQAMLSYKGSVNGVSVKTAFTLLEESANKHSMKEYSDISGVDVAVIEGLAKEFTSHGRKAVAELYRGIAQHTNGFYTSFAIYQLNVLIGNLNWTGGATLGSGSFTYSNERYDLNTIPDLVPASFGLLIGRDKAVYEKSVEFKNKVDKGEKPYPAKRPWFPMASDIFSEIIPSSLEGYPYSGEIFLWHMCTPFNSTPYQGNDGIIEKVKNPKNMPLIIACDITIGDSTMYADYVVPDTTYLERYVHIGSAEAGLTKGTAVRYPVIEPLVGKTKDGRAFCLETFLIDVAETLEMRGFGKNAIKDTKGKMWDLHKAEDFYIKATANLAYSGGDLVKKVSSDDLDATDLASYKKKYESCIDKEDWDKVLYVMSRGGVFASEQTKRKGDKLASQYSGVVSMYSENTAKYKHSMTGENFIGYPTWEPAKTLLGKDVATLDKGMNFTILTRKGALQSHSRLSSNTRIREIMPTNWAEMNMAQGMAMGLKDGDSIEVKTATGSRQCLVRLREGIAKDTVSFVVGYGHKGYGGSDVEVDGKVTKGSKIRSAGINLNPIMRGEPDVAGASLLDPIGGSASFYDTKATITKA